jgi:hypothetical protein
MRTAGTLEAEWKQVLRGSLSMRTNEGESSTGRVRVAGIYRITDRSRLARVLKLMNSLFL